MLVLFSIESLSEVEAQKYVEGIFFCKEIVSASLKSKFLNLIDFFTGKFPYLVW